jgi:hypothetical protein
MGRHLLLVATLGACALLPLTHEAGAQAPAAGERKLDLKRLEKELEQGDPATQERVLGELATARGKDAEKAAQLAAALLTRGASVRLSELALAAVEQLAQPSTTRAVVPYSRHRNADLRQRATRALARTGGPEAVTALRAALRGPDPALRGVAASGLATLGAADAVPDLFLVLSKDVPEAAGAIGKLCTPPDCRKFVDLLGKLPFDPMQAGLEPILLRKETEVPEDLKLDLLERLRKLQTKEVSTFLAVVLARYPASGSPRVKAALGAAASGKPIPKAKP